MVKHTLYIMIALLGFSATAAAQQWSYDGRITVTLANDTLTFSGTGAMIDFANSYTVPYNAYRSSITAVVVDSGITSVGDYAFYYFSSLTSVTLPEGITRIGNFAFGGSGGYSCTSLASVTLPASVTAIGSSAFAYSGLTSITIPAGVTSIGNNAFQGCNSLASMTCLAPLPPTVAGNAFTSYDNSLYFRAGFCLYVPPGALAVYREESGWRNLLCINDTCPMLRWNCGAQGANLTATLCLGTLTISGTGAMADYTGSNSPWYSYRQQITSVVVENGVTRIGNFAFNEHALTSVILPNSLTAIGNRAFQNYTSRNLTSVTLPANLTSIGDYAFDYCPLASVTVLSYTPPALGSNVFSGTHPLFCVGVPPGTLDSYLSTSWSSVTCINDSCPAPPTWSVGAQGSNVTATWCRGTLSITGTGSADGTAPWSNYQILRVEIDSGVTGGITGEMLWFDLSTIAVAANNPAYVLEDGVLFNTGKTTLIKYLAGKPNTSYTIPDGVTSISTFAFYGCTNLTSVTFPNSLLTIGKGAFSNCTNLTSATFPNSLLTIDDYAFKCCDNLTEITIPASVTRIGSSTQMGVFSRCAAPLPLTITCLGSTPPAFGFGGPVVPNGSIFNLAFGGLSCLWVPVGRSSAYRSSWGITSTQYCVTECAGGNTGPLQWSVCGGTLTISGTGAMPNYARNSGLSTTAPWWSYRASITKVVVEEGVTSIGNYAFGYNDNSCATCYYEVEEASLPSTLTSIGNYAFYTCTYLGNYINYYSDIIYPLTIPASVTSIGDYAFGSPISVDVLNPVPATLGSNAFPTFINFCLWVPPAGLSAYMVNSSWNAYCLNGCRRGTAGASITWYLCGASLVISGTGAMADYTGTNAPWNAWKTDITGVVVESGITSIGNYAFNGCTGLEAVVLPASVTSIGQNAFSGCTNLGSATFLSSSPPTLGSNAFQNVHSTFCVYVPEPAITAYQQSFSGFCINGCRRGTAGTSVLWSLCGNALELSGAGAMSSYASGTAPWYSWRDQLVRAEVDSGITSVGNYAFYNCTELTSATLLNPAPLALGSSAFQSVNSAFCAAVPQGSFYPYYNGGWQNLLCQVVVTFEPQGGSAVPPLAVPPGGTATAPNPAPTRASYTLAGWYTGESYGAEWDFNTPLTADRTLYAKWTGYPYTIVYDKNAPDAAGATPASTHEYGAAKSLTKNSYTRWGSAFAGWATAPNGAATYADEQSVTSLTAVYGDTVTLYAVWSVNSYAVAFNPLGGSPAPPAQTVQHGSFASAPTPAPTRAGYTFAGWCADTVSWNAAAWSFAENAVTSDTVLYARWAQNIDNHRCTEGQQFVIKIPFRSLPEGIFAQYRWYRNGQLIVGANDITVPGDSFITCTIPPSEAYGVNQTFHFEYYLTDDCCDNWTTSPRYRVSFVP